MAVIDIDFPGNIGQVDTAADLRGIPSYFLTDNLVYILLEKGFYTWDPSSLADDNDDTVIKPNDRTALQAGRWLLAQNLSDTKLRSDLAAGDGSSAVGFTADFDDAVPTDTEKKLQETVSSLDFASNDLRTKILLRTATSADAPEISAALQKGMDAISAAGGGTMKLIRGLYYVEETGSTGVGLTHKSGVHIEGEGPNLSVIKLADGNPATKIIKAATGATNLGLSNLTIDGNRDNQTFSGSLQGWVGSDNVKTVMMSNVVFLNIYGRALESNGDGTLATSGNEAEDYTISNCFAYNCGTKSFHIRRTKHASVIGCIANTKGVPEGAGPPVNNDNVSAFEASGSSYVTFSGCHARHQTAGWGVSFRCVNNSKYVVFQGGTGFGGRQGISINDVKHVKAQDLILQSTGDDGCLVSAVDLDNNGFGVVRDIVIDNCTFINPNDDGVVCNVTNNGVSVELTVTNCTMYDDGANVMKYGLRNGGGGVIVARQWGNRITNAQIAKISGTWLDAGQETGTWTPAVTFATPGNLSVAYSTQTGSYWTMGDLVFIKGTIITSTFTHTTASGVLQITGLPFSADSDLVKRGIMTIASFRGITKANRTEFGLVAAQGTSTLVMKASGSGVDDQDVTSADTPTGGSFRIEFSGWYKRA